MSRLLKMSIAKNIIYRPQDRNIIDHIGREYGETWKSRNIKFMLDIGAHIGSFSIYCRTLFPKANIIAVEGYNPNFIFLKKNAKKHNFTAIHKAVIGYDHVNYIQINAKNTGGHKFIIRGPGKPLSSITIKDLIEDKNISLLKIDTEGSELDILRKSIDDGSIKQIKFILLEVHGRSMSLPDLLQKNNFSITRQSKRHYEAINNQ